jgi:predicted Ser/Thr protein kinase
VVNVQPLADGDPRRVRDYDVTGRLGEGGQGVVYLGRDSAGPVAIKLLHAQLIEDEQARARFVREVEVTKRVARFCTAQVLSAGLSGGRPYIVSEYVPGPSLHRQVRDDGPRRGSALDRLAINTATALAAIHGAGVVHRDFKPGNVLMGPDGPVVIDFGISRALDASGTMTSAVSQVVGTPAFMAPEQLADGVIGPHTDMFAWAVTMVYAATGVPAFGHRSIPQVINRILHEEPDLGALGDHLRPIVAACLSKDPADRPAARDLMDALMRHNLPAVAPVAATRLPARGTPAALPPGAVATASSPTSGLSSPTRTGSPGGTMRLPAGETASPSGGAPGGVGAPGAPDGLGQMPEPPERRRGRTVLIAGAAAAVAIALIAGIGALASSHDPETDQRTAASPTPAKRLRRPAEHRTPSATRTPTRKAAAVATRSVQKNPYTPQRLCGTGYRVVGAHPVGVARTYLLYNGHAGINCVVTMVSTPMGKIFLNASLAVQGGAHQSRWVSSPFYAGPVRLPARGKCVIWGGAARTAKWLSGWSHCGK